jgi:hypothetical protein
MVIQTGQREGHAGLCKAADDPRLKAPEDWRTPGRFALSMCRRDARQRPGVRRPSAALNSRQRGALIFEVLMAMTILIIAVLPLGFTLTADAGLFRVTYQRAVAMEIVDGEIEILAAGGWHDIPEGSHPYSVHANAAANLPPGRFRVTRAGNHLRLEWSAAKKSGIGPVVREVTVK